MFLTYDPKQNNNKKHAVTRGNVWRSPWSFYACVFRTSQTRKKKNVEPRPSFLTPANLPETSASLAGGRARAEGRKYRFGSPVLFISPASSLASFTQGKEGRKEGRVGWDARLGWRVGGNKGSSPRRPANPMPCLRWRCGLRAKGIGNGSSSFFSSSLLWGPPS